MVFTVETRNTTDADRHRHTQRDLNAYFDCCWE